MKLGSWICPRMLKATAVMSRWVTRKTLTISMSTIENSALIQKKWSHRIRLNKQRRRMQFTWLRRRKKRLSRLSSVKDPNCSREWCKERVSSPITRSWIGLFRLSSQFLQTHRVIKMVQTILERKIRLASPLLRSLQKSQQFKSSLRRWIQMSTSNFWGFLLASCQRCVLSWRVSKLLARR